MAARRLAVAEGDAVAAARIAVVEDDPDLLRLLTALLDECGYRVMPFRDGSAALAEILRDGPPDLVLTDWGLPTLDGVSLCRALRVRYPRSELPIMILSGRAAEEEIMAGLEAGADDYMLKPFQSQLLTCKIRRMLEGCGPAPQEEPLLGEPTPPCQLGGYRLVRQLGTGGSGTVYEAYRLSDGERVAFKLLELSCGVGSEEVGRLMREVGISSSLRIPNLLEYEAAGKLGCRYYLVSRFVEGVDATQLLQTKGPLTVEAVLRIGRDVARAICGLAERGIIHRDVKPDNIMISATKEAVLVDLGLAKFLTAAALTQPDEFFGTLAYFPPELMCGEPEYPGLDLYGLGATLYCLLVGKVPFRIRTPADLLYLAQHPPLVPLVCRARPEVPERIARMIARLHDPDRSRRELDPPTALRELESAYEYAVQAGI